MTLQPINQNFPLPSLEIEPTFLKEEIIHATAGADVSPHLQYPVISAPTGMHNLLIWMWNQ